jgi:uncharacterized membrane protein
LDKETATLALAVVTMLGVLAAVYPVIPLNSEHFSELGVLGPDQKIGGYPTTVTVGQQILLYGYVGNHEGVPSYYQVLVKLGNQSTVVSNSTAASARVIFTHYQVLNDNKSAVFPISLTLGDPATNERLVFELWSFNATSSTFVYTGLWDQFWVNVTGR